MIDGGSHPLTLGTLVTLQPPDTHIDAVLLTNSSPLGCSVNVNGLVNNLPAWTANTFKLAEGAQVELTPVAKIAGASTDNTLTVTWVLDNEAIPGSYPQSLTAQAVAAAIAGTVTTDTAESSLGTGLIANNAFTGFPSAGTVPPGFTDLLLIPGLGSVSGTITVNGVNTGLAYYTGPLSATRPLLVPYSSLADPGGVNVSWSTTGLLSLQLTVIARTSPAIVRSVTATGADGPTTIAQTTLGVAGFVPIIAGGPLGQGLRLWTVSLYSDFNNVAGCTALIRLTGGLVIVENALAFAKASSANPVAQTVTFQGGLPLAQDNHSLNLVHNIAGIWSAATVAYSLE